ncbi:hypothetical protein [Nocardioides sp. YIM 152588]|uniref:hypothetical protein n=1 Tax=Nocardioides sp. YIM 152588 TaxID=3158259 RepID=UPI0032E44A5E
MTTWIEPGEGIPLTGTETFRGLDATVVEFWGYAMRDLRTNTTRGLLAEWLVARAVGATEVQPEWKEFDVRSPDGIRIEVKSSAYLQSWGQARHSTIRFGGLKARAWDPLTGEGEPSFNADVYVFCVQTAQVHASYDPLDVRQWDFYVLPVDVVQRIDQRSLGLRAVQAYAEAVPYEGLADAVRAVSVPGVA